MGAGTNASDGEVWYGHQDSSSWETLSCLESLTSIPPQSSVNWYPTDQPTGAAGRHLCWRSLLFVFKYRGPIHRCIIRVHVNLNRAHLDVYLVRCSMAWTSISILCSLSSFRVPQVFATIATIDMALAKDELLV
jgi:hypothetical protein